MDRNDIFRDPKQIAALARKWRIKELSVFGSAVRDSCSSESDIDLLIEFIEDTHYSLFDLVDLRDELEHLLGRRVDLVEKAGLTNPYRRTEILSSARTIYAA